MGESELEYYRARAAAERRMALEAGRADVAAIHLELAKQYDALVERVDLRQAAQSIRPRLVWVNEA